VALNSALDTKLQPVLAKEDQLIVLVNKLSVPPAGSGGSGNGAGGATDGGSGGTDTNTETGPITDVPKLLASADQIDTTTLAVFDQFLAHMKAAKVFLSTPVRVPRADVQHLTARWEVISTAMNQRARTAPADQRPKLAFKAISIHSLQGEVARLLQQRVI
jgi:hypothetical protein